MFGLGGPMVMVQANGNPQKCALINSTTNIVENVIIADPAVDPAPAGYFLVGLPVDTTVVAGWVYDPATGAFTDPNAIPAE
jgi:hypothetical protein